MPVVVTMMTAAAAASVLILTSTTATLSVQVGVYQLRSAIVVVVVAQICLRVFVPSSLTRFLLRPIFFFVVDATVVAASCNPPVVVCDGNLSITDIAILSTLRKQTGRCQS